MEGDEGTLQRAAGRGRRKYGDEIPWQCSRRSSGELSGLAYLDHISTRGSLTLFRIVTPQS